MAAMSCGKCYLLHGMRHAPHPVKYKQTLFRRLALHKAVAMHDISNYAVSLFVVAVFIVDVFVDALSNVPWESDACARTRSRMLGCSPQALTATCIKCQDMNCLRKPKKSGTVV